MRRLTEQEKEERERIKQEDQERKKTERGENIRIIFNEASITQNQLKLLFSLSEAPDEKKTIYYLQATQNRSYFHIYNDIKKLVAIGLIHYHIGNNNKISYSPDSEKLEMMKERLIEEKRNE